ncbi:hypothetical protein B0O99DRAFT_598625 [Bisporella sp. PMI_857]|nr:hypothetical protein B0O99DRAFT_598625 [Bisporella sp. PMI_857]
MRYNEAFIWALLASADLAAALPRRSLVKREIYETPSTISRFIARDGSHSVDAVTDLILRSDGTLISKRDPGWASDKNAAIYQSCGVAGAIAAVCLSNIPGVPKYAAAAAGAVGAAGGIAGNAVAWKKVADEKKKISAESAAEMGQAPGPAAASPPASSPAAAKPAAPAPHSKPAAQKPANAEAGPSKKPNHPLDSAPPKDVKGNWDPNKSQFDESKKPAVTKPEPNPAAGPPKDKDLKGKKTAEEPKKEQPKIEPNKEQPKKPAAPAPAPKKEETKKPAEKPKAPKKSKTF